MQPITSTPDQARILVVDDEEVIRDILADFLAMEGFEVRTAQDGQAALTEMSRNTYDLVLSDLKMPVMGGLELLEHIKKITPHTVLIIMTGFGTVETAIDAMKRGAYDYVLKPFKVEEVIHTIRRGLDKRRLETENLRLQETLSLYKVSEAIAASLSLDEVLHNVADNALNEVHADLVSVLLDDGQGGYFERVREVNSSLVYTGELGRLDAEVLKAHIEENRVLRTQGRDGLRYFRTQPETVELQSLMVTSLTVRNKIVGFVSVVSFTVGNHFDEGQRKLLSIISHRTAAAIENARLYEDLQATFHQTIRGLASAIDKMDRYTAGHSERVAAYAQILAIKLGLPHEQIEIVRQSALLHDIGKIGCVMNLNKPGKLTQAEYETFQQHPGFGKDILEPITFLHPLIPGVHMHHERWDGHGYPIGLKAQEIPLLARIISVADTYDAMTSDRAYRRALPHEVAVQEIKRCCGSQFDPDVAHEFMEAVLAPKKLRQSLGFSLDTLRAWTHAMRIAWLRLVP